MTSLIESVLEDGPNWFGVEDEQRRQLEDERLELLQQEGLSTGGPLQSPLMRFHYQAVTQSPTSHSPELHAQCPTAEAPTAHTTATSREHALIQQQHAGKPPTTSMQSPSRTLSGRSKRANAGSRIQEILKQQSSLQDMEQDWKWERQTEANKRKGGSSSKHLQPPFQQQQQHLASSRPKPIHKKKARPQLAPATPAAVAQQTVCEDEAVMHGGHGEAAVSMQGVGACKEQAETGVASEESDGQGGRRQMLDHMPGCNRCHFSKAGCDKCKAVPMVTRPHARWKPEGGRPQHLTDAPTYHPTPEEFKDPFAYINSIRQEASLFGICRIVPPPGWDPPFALGKGTNGPCLDSFRFQTRKQYTSHLCMRAPRSFGIRQGAPTGMPSDGSLKHAPHAAPPQTHDTQLPASQHTHTNNTSHMVSSRVGRMDMRDSAPVPADPPQLSAAPAPFQTPGAATTGEDTASELQGHPRLLEPQQQLQQHGASPGFLSIPHQGEGYMHTALAVHNSPNQATTPPNPTGPPHATHPSPFYHERIASGLALDGEVSRTGFSGASPSSHHGGAAAAAPAHFGCGPCGTGWLDKQQGGPPSSHGGHAAQAGTLSLAPRPLSYRVPLVPIAQTAQAEGIASQQHASTCSHSAGTHIPAAMYAGGTCPPPRGLHQPLLPPPPPPPTLEQRVSLYGPFLQPHPLLRSLYTPAQLLTLRQQAQQLLHQLPPLDARRAATAHPTSSAPTFCDARLPPPSNSNNPLANNGRHGSSSGKGGTNRNSSQVASGAAEMHKSPPAPTRVNPVRSSTARAAACRLQRGKLQHCHPPVDGLQQNGMPKSEQGGEDGSIDNLFWGGEASSSCEDAVNKSHQGEASSYQHNVQDEPRGVFGHGYFEHEHTLQSFATYAEWAKALHFGAGCQRRGSCPAMQGNGAVRRANADPHRGSSACIEGSASHRTAASLGISGHTGRGSCVRNGPGGAYKLSEQLHGVQSGGVKVHGHVEAAWKHGGWSAAAPDQDKEPKIEEIEAEFWRLVETPVAGRVVETLYGSDLDSGRLGSGFPLPAWREPPTDAKSGKPLKLDAHAREYSRHVWNINNMPRCAHSILRYVKCDELVTGVMVPWLYIGSCLSAFCWHIEDHALYSVNYLHTGAPKVWYGVPSSASHSFEVAVRDALPHLFEEDPLLLHRLVTMLSPTELMARGVPVHRLVHEAGSFVVTFPGAFHSGFNTGFNVAEAVNFAPPDWLPFGSDVTHKYRLQGKSPTISHDMLLVTIVQAAGGVAERLGRQLPMLPVTNAQQAQPRVQLASSTPEQKQEEQPGQPHQLSALGQKLQQADLPPQPHLQQLPIHLPSTHACLHPPQLSGHTPADPQPPIPSVPTPHQHATPPSQTHGHTMFLPPQDVHMAAAAPVLVHSNGAMPKPQARDVNHWPGLQPEQELEQQEHASDSKPGKPEQQEAGPRHGPVVKEEGVVIKQEKSAEAVQASSTPARAKRRSALAAAATIAAHRQYEAMSGDDCEAVQNSSQHGPGGQDGCVKDKEVLQKKLRHGQQQQQQQHKQQQEPLKEQHWMERWADGVQLKDIPLEGMLHGLAELSVRVAEERKCWDAAKAEGVKLERRMDPASHKVLDMHGMHTSTFDCDCVRCKCDLYLSAVVAPSKPGVCACVEHWQDIGVPAGQCILLYRHSVAELEAMLSEALGLFPEAASYIEAAHARQATQCVAYVHELGPIVQLEGLGKTYQPRSQDPYTASLRVEDPFASNQQLQDVPACTTNTSAEQGTLQLQLGDQQGGSKRGRIVSARPNRRAKPPLMEDAQGRQERGEADDSEGWRGHSHNRGGKRCKIVGGSKRARAAMLAGGHPCLGDRVIKGVRSERVPRTSPLPALQTDGDASYEGSGVTGAGAGPVSRSKRQAGQRQRQWGSCNRGEASQGANARAMANSVGFVPSPVSSTSRDSQKAAKLVSKRGKGPVSLAGAAKGAKEGLPPLPQQVHSPHKGSPHKRLQQQQQQQQALREKSDVNGPAAIEPRQGGRQRKLPSHMLTDEFITDVPSSLGAKLQAPLGSGAPSDQQEGTAGHSNSRNSPAPRPTSSSTANSDRSTSVQQQAQHRDYQQQQLPPHHEHHRKGRPRPLLILGHSHSYPTLQTHPEAFHTPLPSHSSQQDTTATNSMHVRPLGRSNSAGGLVHPGPSPSPPMSALGFVPVTQAHTHPQSFMPPSSTPLLLPQQTVTRGPASTRYQQHAHVQPRIIAATSPPPHCPSSASLIPNPTRHQYSVPNSSSFVPHPSLNDTYSTPAEYSSSFVPNPTPNHDTPEQSSSFVPNPHMYQHQNDADHCCLPPAFVPNTSHPSPDTPSFAATGALDHPRADPPMHFLPEPSSAPSSHAPASMPAVHTAEGMQSMHSVDANSALFAQSTQLPSATPHTLPAQPPCVHVAHLHASTASPSPAPSKYPLTQQHHLPQAHVYPLLRNASMPPPMQASPLMGGGVWDSLGEGLGCNGNEQSLPSCMVPGERVGVGTSHMGEQVDVAADATDVMDFFA